MAIDNGKKKEPTTEELLDEVELRIDRLKVMYEQYFIGIQKLAPLTARREITRTLLQMTQLNIRNTGLRFRFNTLNQKWSTYTTYWNRTCSQIENGTYVRDIARAQRNLARRGLELPEEMRRNKAAAAVAEKEKARVFAESEPGASAEDLFSGGTFDIDSMFDSIADTKSAGTIGVGVRFDGMLSHSTPLPPSPTSFADAEEITRPHKSEPRMSAARRHITRPAMQAAKRAESSPALLIPRPTPASSPAAAMPARPRPAAVPPPTPQDPAIREIFQRYVAAKKQVGEATDKISYESIAKTIAKTTPAVMQQHACKAVEFAVAIKDNKVILKAIPRK